MSLSAARARKRATAAEVSPKITGDVLFTFPVVYQGSKRAGLPYGDTTAETAARKLLEKKDPDRRQVSTTIVVTYTGLFVLTTRDGDMALMAFGPREIGLVWADRQDDSLFVLVSHSDDPVAVSCHMFTVDKDGDRGESLPELVEALNTASIGRYPGALGVFAAEYGGSVSVDSPNGNEVVNGAMKRIKELEIPERAVEIVIYETRISVIDRDSGNELKAFFIPEVSYTAIDPKRDDQLSVITRDAQFGLLYCHAFSISGGSAGPIPRTIGVAFQRVTALMQTADREKLKELGLLVASKGTSGAIGVFAVKHIATAPTKGERGDETVQRALDAASRKGTAREPLLLVVSEDGLRAIDGLTSEVNSSTAMQHVSFITTIGEKKDIFGFISVDSRLKRKLVHLYQCSSAVSLNISKAVGEAFKLCAQRMKEAKANKNRNPFRAVDKTREAAPGTLFKCQLHRADILPDKVIGAGQFGQVFLAHFKKETRVAVKTVRLAASDDDKEDFVREAEVMLDLVHPGLVKLLGVAVQQRPWLCVIEFMKYGDLRDVLQTCKERNFTLSKWEQLRIVQQICDGLRFMASKRYIHMDVAARNCLMAEGNVVKLADFGLTRELDPGTNRYLLKKTAKLPVRWVALEALETGVFSQASDVWAFGVLVWEVLSYGVLPYADVANAQVQKRVKGGLRLERPAGSWEDLFIIAQSCWKLPKKMRPLFNPLSERLKGLADEAKADSVPERDVGLACQEDH